MIDSFAIYRLPLQRECVYIRQADGGSSVVPDFLSASGSNCFVIAPFAGHPVVSIAPDRRVTSDESRESSDERRETRDKSRETRDKSRESSDERRETSDESRERSSGSAWRWESCDFVPEAVRCEINNCAAHEAATYSPESQPDTYFEEFAELHDRLMDGSLEKVVLSRRVNVALPGDTEAFDLFARACSRFPRCYVALFCTPATGVWLVASPEVLLECVDGRGHTMALAGTIPLDEYESGRVWADKDRREQAYVSDYIARCLAENVGSVERMGPETAQAANLVHLRTDFYFGVDSQGCRRLVEALHPTPAVCGVPKAAAYDAICRSEYASRDYYSGFSGPFAGDADTHLFVTLRCMRIGRDVCTLYAGGGLVAGSEAAAELAETEHKLQPMKSIIDNV